MPEIIQVNVSLGGVPKRSVPDALITTQGVEGDAWAHPRIHGRSHQKVLIISAEVIDELAAEGFPVFYGALGENLTVRGAGPADWRPGQTWRAGDAILELTEVREPCGTLDVYRHPDGRRIQAEIYDPRVEAGDSSSPLWGRSGFYAAVRKTGRVAPGAPFELLYQLA
jgi:MOSC domain-containing protein YiiM